MREKTPKLVNPVNLARQGCKLQGSIALTQLKRLQDRLLNTQGEVNFAWQFGLDKKQRPLITGEIATQLTLQCQRCLQPLCWPLQVSTALIVLSEGEREEDLPPDYEVLTLEKPEVPLLSLVEDELILALPMVAKHSVCSIFIPIS